MSEQTENKTERHELQEKFKLNVEKYLDDYKDTLPIMALLSDDLKINLTINTIDLDGAVETVIKDNPKFKDMGFIQLKNNEEFQEALKSQLLVISEVANSIETLNSKIPETAYITNNKLSNEMTKDFLNKGTITLAIINPNKKGEISTYNTLTYEGKNIEITGKDEFTAYDRAIHNAVCTLYAAGNNIITPAMVYRAVNGMTENEKVSSQSVKAVKNSLDKSRFMRLTVDFSEEAKARNMDVDKVIIDSNLLEARIVSIKAGRHQTDAYKIYAMPVLYQYSQRTKQIISVPFKLLDTKDAIRNTEEIIPIKEYLIRRIEIMKHDKKMSNKIIYDTLFKEIGVEQPNKKKSFDLRAGIKSILTLWKSKKYIVDFNEYKQGNSVKGIDIIF